MTWLRWRRGGWPAGMKNENTRTIAVPSSQAVSAMRRIRSSSGRSGAPTAILPIGEPIAAGRLPVVVGGGVGVDEVLLQAGDVVPGPVDLPGEQGAERAGVGRVDWEVDGPDAVRCRPGSGPRTSPGSRPSIATAARSPGRRSPPGWCTAESGT